MRWRSRLVRSSGRMRSMLAPVVPMTLASTAPAATTADTIYDAASLTKVVATTTAVMQLVEQGKIDANVPQMAIDRYRLHDVNAGTSGSTGGEN